MAPAVLTKPAGVGLIQRKLSPPPGPDPFLSRPRLEQLLVALVEEHPVVVISATAGAGKTTAATAAAKLLKRPLCWLSVDRTDAAAGRLVTYLEAALARQVPELASVATEALARGIQHPEAAGLLAEAVGKEHLVLVIDDIERMGGSGEAWAVLEALIKYSPAALRIVLISRCEVPVGALGLSSERQCAVIDDRALAFTAEEAAQALTILGEGALDADEVVHATGGWVAGVLFQAWRPTEQGAGSGGEPDPLDGYLSTQVLEQVDGSDREFLVTTSVLEEVTVARAAAIGEPEPGEHLQRLRAVRLPVVWDQRGATMRCHPLFREHLLQRLKMRGPEQVQELRIAHGRLLAHEGHFEEATEELLGAGAPAEAIEAAELAIIAVVERLDFPIAGRWLAELQGVPRSQPSQLTVAEMMLALARDDYRAGVRIADQLAEQGERDELARSSDRAAALMGCFYLGAGRIADVRAVLDAADVGPETSILRYTLGLYADHADPGDAVPSGGPMDMVLGYANYFHGRLKLLAESPASRWATEVGQPFQIAARSAMGYTHEALEHYEAAEVSSMLPVSLAAYVGPEVLIDAGRAEDARRAIAHGRRMAEASGAIDLLLINGLMEAKLALRLERDPAAGGAVLERLEREPAAREFPFIIGPLEAWRGFAQLLESADSRALVHLRNAVKIMLDADLKLELPTTAVYLAEAEWRAGNEEAADHAADLALEASRQVGSNHCLLQALADFPAVVSRRIDAERHADSQWHDLGRALIAQGTPVPTHVASSVRLREFGELALVVNGEAMRPRITKSYELLAYLIARHGAPTERDDLLDALFDGRSDDSTRSYLRQAVHWLRRVLPDDGLIVEGRQMRIGDNLVVVSESVRFEEQLAEAARLDGQDRLAATLDSLKSFDKGEYLPGAASAWVDDRRAQLTERATDARGEAAELAFAAGDYPEARRLAAVVLRADPLREVAWRLMMRIANALGDDDGTVAAFRRCEQALARIGTPPAPSTRALLERLRR